MRLRGEQGMVLPIALGILAVLTISTMVVIDSSSSNARSAVRSKGDKVAFALAEAGINNAIAVLMKPGTNALNKYDYCPASDTAPALPCWNTNAYDGGTVQWTGQLTVQSASAYWTLVSTSTVRNPDGSRPLHRTLTARAPVYPAPSQPLNSPSWNYIYSRALGTGQPFNGCDMTLTNQVEVTSPLFVNGNLCLENKARIAAGGLFVRGSLTQNSTQNYVGTSTVRLNDAHIAKGCKYAGQNAHTPCVGGDPSAGDKVWALTLDTNAGAIQPPNVLWNEWYLNASPGPYYPCNPAVAGEAPNPTWAWDTPVAAGSASDLTKLTYKNNNAGLVNLTPVSSYSCKTWAGELSWNATTRVLTIKGTMYLDGSAKIDNGQTNSYVGSGVIYMSGTLLVKNSKLCGKLDSSNSNNCTTSGWNPNANLMTFVANGNGATGAPDSQVPVGDSVYIVSSHVQGAIYGANIVDAATTSLVDGPLDGSTVILGQTSNSSFPPFTIVPAGMPGNAAVYAVAGNPQLFSG
jgi:Tfp pilus assembly protein PilX